MPHHFHHRQPVLPQLPRGFEQGTAGSWDHCDSSIASKGVNIFSEQIGRVAWTVTVEAQADHEAKADYAICADHGDKTFTRGATAPSRSPQPCLVTLGTCE